MTSTRIWSGKEAQEAERPCTSWNDMILPKEYSWSDLEVDNTEHNVVDPLEVESWHEPYPSDSSLTNSSRTDCARAEELNEKLLESAFVPANRRDCRIDPDDEWSSDDESDDDDDDDDRWGSEYESDDEDFDAFIERNFDDWPSYHQD
ncbi:hypothetical protein FSPOR_11299 [Fusarium sporotrichioides]|uniref:Uncharacterized protein n=1 Tax=Fusarium sporotrichioides TaxID=5514 RepID=A0A395RI34_FUSSP|nr:hypothetical protein FSPOR_11299 [Fusarium sporotrichioides]